MKTARIAVLLVVLCLCISVHAQQDTSVSVAPLTIVKRFNSSISTKVIQNDTNIQKAFVQNSLADALVQNNLVHVKSYGTGLQTVAFRGTGAEHTAVFWEGIQLNSSMNGTFDFSLLPSFFTNEVLINYGDGGAGVGNAAVGGTIHTGSKLIFKNQKEGNFQFQGGSYDNYSAGIGFLRGSKRFVSRTKIYMQSAENDFVYQNKFKAGKPDERVRNNNLIQAGVMQQLGYSWKRQYLKFSTLYLNSNRELYNTSSPSADESQEDRTWRSTLRYDNFISKKWSLNAMLGYSNEYLRYLDPSIEDSKYYVNAYHTKVGLRRRYRLSEFNLLLQTQMQDASSDNYNNQAKRTEHNIGLAFKTNISKNILSKTAVKATMFKGEILPLNIGQAIFLKASKRIQVNASINSIYRLPTFNDLFWLGAGDLNLRPEQGWKQDLSLLYKSKVLNAEVSGFNILLDDWLIWLPNGSKWEPQNIRKVRSRGLELLLSKELVVNKIKINLKGNYSYTKTTNEQVESGNESILGKQLIYVPFHKASASIAIGNSKWKFTTYLNYTGESYTSSNNTKSLESFAILSAGISRNFIGKQRGVNIGLSLRNILDQRYEVLPGNPVPGRTLWVKLNIKLKK